MKNITTEICLPKQLFEQIEHIATQLQISRSRFFCVGG